MILDLWTLNRSDGTSATYPMFRFNRASCHSAKEVNQEHALELEEDDLHTLELVLTNHKVPTTQELKEKE